MKHIHTFETFVNEALTADNITVEPNKKLLKDTGCAYISYYLSTQAKDIMVDFSDPKHIELLKLIVDQAKKLDADGELSSSEVQKGRNMFKKVLGENVSYSKYDGPDCTFRLRTSSDIKDFTKSKSFSNYASQNKMIEKYI